MIELFRVLQQVSVETNTSVYLVGGIVRDIVLGLPAQDDDIDLCVEGNSEEFGTAVVRHIGGVCTAFPRFMTAKITELPSHLRIAELDIASTRTELYQKPGALPEVTPASLELDLARRDFACNALAIPLQLFAQWYLVQSNLQQFRSHIIDRHDGIADIDGRLVRILHSKSFIDDPTRLFRAYRYCARFAGLIEEETLKRVHEALSLGVVNTISLPRKVNEMCRIAEELEPGLATQLIADAGLLAASNLVTTQSLATGVFQRKVAVLRDIDREQRPLRTDLMRLFLAQESGQPEVFLKQLGLAKAHRKELELVVQARQSIPTPLSQWFTTCNSR